MAKAIVTAIFINGFEIKREDDMSWGVAGILFETLGPEPTPEDIEDLVDLLRYLEQLINKKPPDKDIIAEFKPKTKSFIYWQSCLMHFQDIHVKVARKLLDESVEKEEDAIDVFREF